MIADSKEEVTTKLNVWREGLEKKGLRVKLSKTQLMVVGERCKLYGSDHVQFVVKLWADTVHKLSVMSS